MSKNYFDYDDSDLDSVFCEELFGCGLLIPIDKFKEVCKNRAFIDSDGSGDLVMNGKMATIDIYPSDAEHIPDHVTHIMWYNK